MKPVRIQRNHAQGWRMPADTVYVGRGSRWGNPFRVGEKVCLQTANKWEWRISRPEHVCTTAAGAVTKFATCLGLDDCMIAVVRRELKGKNLACWCEPGQPCHADILIEIANPVLQ